MVPKSSPELVSQLQVNRPTVVSINDGHVKELSIADNEEPIKHDIDAEMRAEVLSNSGGPQVQSAVLTTSPRIVSASSPLLVSAEVSQHSPNTDRDYFASAKTNEGP